MSGKVSRRINHSPLMVWASFKCLLCCFENASAFPIISLQCLMHSLHSPSNQKSVNNILWLTWLVSVLLRCFSEPEFRDLLLWIRHIGRDSPFPKKDATLAEIKEHRNSKSPPIILYYTSVNGKQAHNLWWLINIRIAIGIKITITWIYVLSFVCHSLLCVSNVCNVCSTFISLQGLYNGHWHYRSTEEYWHTEELQTDPRRYLNSQPLLKQMAIGGWIGSSGANLNELIQSQGAI